MKDDNAWFMWLVTLAIVVGSLIGSLSIVEMREENKKLKSRVSFLEFTVGNVRRDAADIEHVQVLQNQMADIQQRIK